MKNKRKVVQVIVTLAILVVGVVGLKILVASRPETKRAVPPVAVPIVRTVTVKTGPHAVVLEGHGTVRPEKEVQLVPQVSGKVVFVSASLVNGGEFHQGDVLMGIDPADYTIAVTLAEARVKEAESGYQMAAEEAEAARYEWQQLDAGKQPPALVVKEPQLEAARALLAAERANLQKARLQLDRTRLTAPFDGRVSQESVDVGQYVTPGQIVATLYSTDAAEIAVPLETGDLYWFGVPGFTGDEDAGAVVDVRARIAGRELSMAGQVVRAEGQLDARTRMINVIVRVPAPYAAKPPLAAGLFATVHISGRTLEAAAVVPRAALRADDTVWVVTDGVLNFRNVTVARVHSGHVIVSEGLKDDDQVVVSTIKAVSDGMTVRPVPVELEDAS